MYSAARRSAGRKETLLFAAGEERAGKVETTAFFGFFDMLCFFDMLNFFASEVECGTATSSRERRSSTNHQSQSYEQRYSCFFHVFPFLEVNSHLTNMVAYSNYNTIKENFANSL